MFAFKKLVTTLFFPLPLALVLAAAGLALLWAGRGRRWGRALLTAAFGLLLVFSYPPLPGALLGSLEGAAPADTAQATVCTPYIVVLGGGASDAAGLPPNEQLSFAALARLAEGLRRLRACPSARLVVSGARIGGARLSEASVLREAALALGAPEARILVEEASMDTDDQARNVGRIVGAEPFVLVTSAFHMPRAQYLFRQAGLQPLPAPAGRLLKGGAAAWWSNVFPDADNLRVADLSLKEYLGMAWYRLRSP